MANDLFQKLQSLFAGARRNEDMDLEGKYKPLQGILPKKMDANATYNYEKANLQGNPIQVPSREMGKNLRDLNKVEIGFQPKRSIPDPTLELTGERENTANRDMTDNLAKSYMKKFRTLRNSPFARTAERTDFRKYKGD